MKTHELKIEPVHYHRVAAGTKTFEIRKNDRDFKSGDIVELRYFLGGVENQIDRRKLPTLVFKIGDVYPIDETRVVFSLLAVF
jgi:hypothetical protein